MIAAKELLVDAARLLDAAFAGHPHSSSVLRDGHVPTLHEPHTGDGMYPVTIYTWLTVTSL